MQRAFKGELTTSTIQESKKYKTETIVRVAAEGEEEYK